MTSCLCRTRRRTTGSIQRYRSGMSRRVGVWTTPEFVLFPIVVAVAVVGVVLLGVGAVSGLVAGCSGIACAVALLALNLRLLRRVRRVQS
jgi:hypothetical protein